MVRECSDWGISVNGPVGVTSLVLASWSRVTNTFSHFRQKCGAMLEPIVLVLCQHCLGPNNLRYSNTPGQPKPYQARVRRDSTQVTPPPTHTPRGGVLSVCLSICLSVCLSVRRAVVAAHPPPRTTRGTEQGGPTFKPSTYNTRPLSREGQSIQEQSQPK